MGSYNMLAKKLSRAYKFGAIPFVSSITYPTCRNCVTRQGGKMGERKLNNPKNSHLTSFRTGTITLIKPSYRTCNVIYYYYFTKLLDQSTREFYLMIRIVLKIIIDSNKI